MSINSSATAPSALPISTGAAGLGWGLLGVVAFSLTVPLTRLAVGGLSPLLIGSGRAVVAAALAALALAATGQALPRGTQWARIGVVAAGIVVGFPLLTSYALTVTPAGHGAVVIAVLPAMTAVVVVLRSRQPPATAFWVFAGLGALASVTFALLGSGGSVGLHAADLLLLGAVLAAAVGYAEGGLLAREVGAWQTVSWALVLASPVMLTLTAWAVAQQPPTATPTEWACFGYLSVVSMYLGFFAWYRGLAIGPMATVSQAQLVQPVLSIGWAALLLGEHVTWPTFVGGLAVILCAGGAVRLRLAAPRGS